MLITLDEFIGEHTWWPAYCPNVSNHQIKVAELPEAEVVPEGIQQFPIMPVETASCSFLKLPASEADKGEGPIVATVQIDGEVDSGIREHHNEITGSEVSVSTEQNLETTTTSAAPEVDDFPDGLNRPLAQFATTTAALTRTSENSPAFSTEAAEPILVTRKLTSCDELVGNSEVISASGESSIPLTPKFTVKPSASAIRKTSPSSEMIERRKDVKVKLKELKKFVRFIRKFAKFQKRTNRKRKAEKTGGESKPDAGPSAPKERKLSTTHRTLTAQRPTTSAAKVPSVRKFQNHGRGKNLARRPKNPPPPRSVAQFFGKSTNGRASMTRPISATSTATLAETASPNSNSTSENGSEITGPALRPGTPDSDLDFDSFGNKLEGDKDFFDDLLGHLPEVGIDEADLLDLSGMDDGDVPDLIDLELIDDYIGAQMKITTNTAVSSGTGSVE